MRDLQPKHDAAASQPPLIGDHLALDLLNTQARSGTSIVDFWRTGEDVADWLARCGVEGGPVNTRSELETLFAKAQALRTLAYRLIEGRRRDGVTGDASGLNAYLDAYLTAPHLEQDANGMLVLTRRPHGQPVASALGPVAQAVAQLLVDGDFALVKQCEHPDCILWFYDRTKAHKRRWCSMASCGNRHKAAQFRKRSSRAAA